MYTNLLQNFKTLRKQFSLILKFTNTLEREREREKKREREREREKEREREQQPV